MIAVKLTIGEIVDIISANPNDCLLRRLKQALEEATHQQKSVSIRGFSDHIGIIPAIKALRAQFGWGLKDTKDFCEEIRGNWVATGGFRNPGAPRTVSVPAGDVSKFSAALAAAGVDFIVLES